MTKKSKIKLSIIDDYTKIILLKNFLNNSFDDVEIDSTSSFLLKNLKEKTATLVNYYEKLVSVLKLRNNSFEVLQKELETNNQQYELLKSCNFKKLQSTLFFSLEKINSISASLQKKLNCLKLELNILNAY